MYLYLAARFWGGANDRAQESRQVDSVCQNATIFPLFFVLLCAKLTSENSGYLELRGMLSSPLTPKVLVDGRMRPVQVANSCGLRANFRKF